MDRILRGSGFTRRSLLSATRSDDRPRALWRALTGKRLLIKEIRSNLMVGWLARTFDLCVVLLLRHPCATVASQASLGWGTKPKIVDDLLLQRELVEDHLKNALPQFDSGVPDSTPARLAIRWAVENRVALAMAASDALSGSTSTMRAIFPCVPSRRWPPDIRYPSAAADLWLN